MVQLYEQLPTQGRETAENREWTYLWIGIKFVAEETVQENLEHISAQVGDTNGFYVACIGVV